MKEVIPITYKPYSSHKTSLEQQYDAAAKHLLSIREVQAKILKAVVHEVKDYEIEEIMTFIDPTSMEAGKHPLSNFIGDNTESKILEEGVITYDIRYRLCIPNEPQPITIIINTEAQKDTPSKYSLVSRGIFYCARLLSEQLNTEFEIPYYDNLKKVYSIWINMNPPKKYENTIEIYGIKEKTNHNLNKPYDKLDVIIINLGKDIQEEDGILRELGILFSKEIESKERNNLLKTSYNKDEIEILEVANHMCNLSLGIREEGRKEERANLLKELFNDGVINEKTMKKYLMENDCEELDEQQVKFGGSKSDV